MFWFQYVIKINPVAAIFFVFKKVAAIRVVEDTRIAATSRRREDSCYRCYAFYQQAFLLDFR